ncbi:carboxypeptidase regulatory-like domain-containing protein [Sphingomonas sp. S1-29]|uniref:carboxypeptidase regulatory-like domain-containing protein n=1 Tax=Sphingomonas sp. S1-29 TaxID=2991074 RepID=UPI00223F8EDF|nr:carboxypeptidase regulatory-like domain-containing protein [Sphingomonas sp. S1-29]UZK70354.1 carboxypeptidase regulatory-like domain-containing protein [Sphingomonas sp. S1-29]
MTGGAFTWSMVAVVGSLLVASWLLVRRGLGPRRLVPLLALQWLAGAALLLFLFPPSVPIGGGSLTVVTSPIAAMPTGNVVSLPEAGSLPGAKPVPDFAAAIASVPAGTPIELLGLGLVERDRIAVANPLRFTPPPQPVGIVAIAFPEPTAPGAGFAFGGQTSGLAGGTVEMLDPAGTRVARVPIGADGQFALSGTAPVAGTALFTLVARNRSGGIVERLAIPVDSREPTPPRLLILAGAPSTEVRQLRRFAEDAGIDVTLRVDLGAGLQTGDAPVAIDRATLARTDLLLIDDRRWERLGGGERGAIGSAVSGGMGLLLRPTGPLPAGVRRDWASLGLAVSGGDASLPVRIDDTPDALPLARRNLSIGGANTVTMLRDSAGEAIAAWAPRGRGRVGLSSITDSYALTLTGAPERYSALWSVIFSTLAREGDAAPPRLATLVRAGGRGAVCGLADDARLLSPDGGVSRLLVDRAAKDCAAFWPQQAGWHVVRDAKDRETALYVHPTDAAPALAAAQRREATLALIGSPSGEAAERSALGPRWPWLLLLLALLAPLWWLERRRVHTI